MLEDAMADIATLAALEQGDQRLRIKKRFSHALTLWDCFGSLSLAVSSVVLGPAFTLRTYGPREGRHGYFYHHDADRAFVCAQPLIAHHFTPLFSAGNTTKFDFLRLPLEMRKPLPALCFPWIFTGSACSPGGNVCILASFCTVLMPMEPTCAGRSMLL